MPEGGYKIRNTGGIHFITFAVVDWVDVFTRKAYCDIFLDSIKYCQAQKNLLLHAWCLMSNHVHLAMSAKNNDPGDILRDFKKYTSKQIIKAIETNKSESRRNWMLKIFKEAGDNNSRNSNYQFWQQDNHPEELWSEKFTSQKLNYIHSNPVAAGIVDKAEEYRYSSARDYYYGRQCGLLEINFYSCPEFETQDSYLYSKSTNPDSYLLKFTSFNFKRSLISSKSFFPEPSTTGHIRR